MTASIGAATEVDYFKLDLSGQTGDTDVSLFTVSDNLALAMEVDLFDFWIRKPNQDALGDERWITYLRYGSLPAESHLFAVWSPDNGTGDYTLSAKAVPEHGRTRNTATTLSLDAPTSGRLTSTSDADYFKLVLTEAKNLAVMALAYDGVDAVMLNSGGTEIPVNVEISDLDERILDDFAPGTYYVKITAPGASSSSPVYYALYAYEDTGYGTWFDGCADATNDLDSSAINDPLYACQWHLNSDDSADMDINVELVWADPNITGAGVNVAVVDGTIDYSHADLTANINSARNHDYGGRSNAYRPAEHHGTNVAGVIAARDNTIGVRGVAPRATIYGYNILADGGAFSTDANEADAMARNRVVTAVSNNSWGPVDGYGLDHVPAVWEMAIDRGVTQGYAGKGVFYAWAGGNGHEKGDNSNFDEFGNYYGVTAVCAVGDDGIRSNYSEQGANLWVCAPSDGGDRGDRGIVTTDNSDRYTNTFNGTSSAAPKVSGVAALLRHANPDLTWRDLKLILAASARQNDPTKAGWEEGARKYGSTDNADRYHFNHEYGFGVVDAAAAIALARDWSTLPEFQNASSKSGTLDRTIPDNPASRITSSISLDTEMDFTEFVEITVKIDHIFWRDLRIELVSPAGIVSELAVPVDLSLESRSKTPESTVSPGTFRFGAAKHLGETPDGAWTLRVADELASDQGTLTSWSIKVYGHRGVATGAAPDLVVGAPTVSASNPTAGELFTLFATVRNQGSGAAGSTTLRYYRSSDSTISSSDTPAGTDAVSGLSAGATSPESIGLTAPSSAGTYYYGGCVDPVSDETDTTNNCSVSVAVTVGAAPAPDLVVDTPTVSASNPTAGATFTLSATVRNQGSGAAASTTLRYYRSADSTISSGDTAVGTDPVSGLAASGTSPESIGLTAPSTAGTYYYGACVDPVSDESDTTNNCSTEVTVTVVAPPDLVVGTPTVSDSSLLTSASFTLRATVRNQGGSAAAASTLRYYRSSNATIDRNDSSIGTDTVSSLSAGADSAESISVTAPSTAGTYHYGACVDAVTNESDTANNCSAAVTVTVGAAPAPDLVVDAPTVSASNPTAGTSFTLSATVRNQGSSSSASTTLRYYRSTDSTITSSDTPAGTDPVSGLSAGNTSAESISVTAPSTAGTYHYGACVDAVTNESATGNNCSAAVTVTVVTPPDLVVDAPTVSASNPTAGTSFTLSATVRNQGGSAAPSSTLRYYRSSNATIDTNATSVGTDPVSGLAAAGTSAESIDLTAPTTAGTYYYGACVGTVTNESDTTNNCSTAVTVTVGATPAPAGDYDTDNDGLIEISNLSQLNAIRWDLDGDGESRDSGYAQAFPGAVAGMGCPDAGCSGYELTIDLDFDTNGNGQLDAGDAYWNGGAGWEPISGFGFEATFDGADHTIANLYINRKSESSVGLFGSTDSDSVIRKVGLVFASVKGHNEVGSLVGDHRGKIDHSYATGSVNGNSEVGGLVGSVWGSTIESSYATSSVTGTGNEVGGLVGGSFSSGVIVDSHATGNVAGNSQVGGLIGSNWSVTVRNSYASGSVTGTGYGVGGLVGSVFSSATVVDSHAAGTVAGTNQVGGLVGSGSRADVSNSYSTGDVTGTGEVGGLIGSARGTITGSYATGTVTATGGEVGGLVGSISGASITGSYATGNVTTAGDAVGGLVGGSFGSSTVTASYATGRVNGNRRVAGLLGFSWGVTIRNSYAVGAVSGNDDVGGLVGDKFGSDNNVISSYWDTQSTGQLSSVGGTGQSTSQLQSPTSNTGIYADWNADWWDFGTSSQYPVLKYGGLSVTDQRNTDVAVAPGPDLVVDPPTLSNSNPTAGASFTLSARVRNQGSASSGSTTLRYYRSTDSTITSSDTPAGTDPVSGLSAGADSAESISVTAPSTPGTYYYGACVSTVTNESNTANNCSAAVTVTVGAAPAPDLVVDTPTVSDSSPLTGASFTLQVTVRNQGNDRSGITYLHYYRSTDSTITAADTQVGTDDVVFHLDASESSDKWTDLTAPSTPGTYYYGACVDAVRDESDTTNNCSSGVAVAVGTPPAPDLVVGAPSPPHVMLRVVRVTEDWMPFASTGGWTAAVERKESETLKYYEAAIWEETASVHLYEFPNDYDPHKGYRPNENLTDDEKIAYREQFLIKKYTNMPQAWTEARSAFLKSGFKDFASRLVNRHPSSEHHLMYSGHGGPGGRLFGGNLKREDAHDFLEFWKQSLGKPLGVVDMGGPCNKGSFADLDNFCDHVKYFVASDLPNGGYTMDDWTYEKYRETDPETQYHSLLSSNESLEEALIGRIDLKRRAYEYSRNNMVSNQVEQANYLYSCDLFLEFSPEFKSFLEELDTDYDISDDLYQFMVNNAAEEVLIDGFNDVFVHSADNKDFFEWSVVANGMLMPQPPPVGPDLVVGAPSVSDSNTDTGAPFTLSVTVRNQGSGAAGSTTLRYYRSTDSTISSSDTPAGTDAVSRLSAGATSPESIGLTAPSSAGTYYYGGCVDPVSDETDTTNNCSVSVAVTVGAAPAPDLVVDAPTVSASNPTAGATFTLSATVRNQGSSLSASTTLRYYRSTDSTITSSDTPAGTDPVSGLGAGNTSAESISVTAPSTAGTYHYGACVDAVTNESDTANNCSAAVTVTVGAARATRSFSPPSVAPAGEVVVMISASGYGSFGAVTETLPSGFSYVSSSLEDDSVTVNGREVRFRLLGETDFTYTVAAPDAAGTYSFSGVLRNSDREEVPVGGALTMAVADGDPLIVRYDDNNNGTIEKSEVIAAINDYLFGEGDETISKSDVIKLINLYLFG